MESPLRFHLIFLNEQLQELKDLLTRPTTPGERANIEARVALAEQALDHYRRAFQIESTIRTASSDAGNAQPN
jgi:hypothetical protein